MMTLAVTTFQAIFHDPIGEILKAEARVDVNITIQENKKKNSPTTKTRTSYILAINRTEELWVFHNWNVYFRDLYSSMQ